MNGMMLFEFRTRWPLYVAIACSALLLQFIIDVDTAGYGIYLGILFSVLLIADLALIQSPVPRHWYAFISSSGISKEEIVSNQLRAIYIELIILALLTFTILSIFNTLKTGTSEMNMIVPAMLFILSVSIVTATVYMNIVQWFRRRWVLIAATVGLLLLPIIASVICIIEGTDVWISGIAVIVCIIVSALSIRTGERFVRGADI